MKKYGAYVGRFNPIHLAHKHVLAEMLHQHGPQNSLLIIGSANTPWSLRHFFSYDERRGFIKKMFPDVRIVGIPDFPNSDLIWLQALDDMLHAAGIDPEEVTFYGGCEEDMRVFVENGRHYTIFNRFDGTTPKISATEVRDALMFDRALDELVDPSIADDLSKLFKEKWEKFKKL
jgi:bifunctional NMN adenylyltransferase/nudix hydrolase